MPFISKDWRSPGEHWVKTEEGWEKKKILECRSPTARRSSSSTTAARLRQEIDAKERKDSTGDEDLDYAQSTWMGEDDKENCRPIEAVSSDADQGFVQPHCQITLKCTKEIAGFNGLSDAIKRLDFLSAVHDGRRFRYICKLLEELLSHRLSSLSGCARRVLLAMLEEVACEVSASQTNMHLLQQLLSQLRHTTEWACWGHPLGSTRLWDQHLRAIERIIHIAEHVQITQPDECVEPRLQHLPEECVREVLLRLSDHKDLARAGEAWGVMARVADEQRIWRELCAFHFTPQQLARALEDLQQPPQPSSPLQNSQIPSQQQQQEGVAQQQQGEEEEEEQGQEQIDWQYIYHKLRKSCGLREDYTEILSLCRQCRCLFWQSLGHPCIVERDLLEMQSQQSPQAEMEPAEDQSQQQLVPQHVPIPPQAFLKFFSL